MIVALQDVGSKSKLTVLEERVANHISGFKWFAGLLTIWLSTLSVSLYDVNSSIG